MEHGVEELCELVARAQARDVDAYGAIVRRFQDMAYGYGHSLLGDFHAAQDAAQEAFVEAYRDLPNLRRADAFPGWFRRIVFKHCDRLTRRKRLPTAPLDAAAAVAAPGPDPAQELEGREMRDRVLEAIAALPEGERTATSLYYINGYSQGEIAEFLEVPVTTVKNRLHRSRKRLRERMMTMVDETMKSAPLPGDFADMVVRMVSSEEDLKGAAKYLADSHHGRREQGAFESVEAARGSNIYIVREQGEVVSAGYYDEMLYGIGSTVLPVARPREMAGEDVNDVDDPAFHDFLKGYQGCFKMAQERGRALALVHGAQYQHAFCGFVPSFYYPVATLPCEVAKSLRTSAVIRQARDEGEAEAGREAQLRDPHATKMSAGIGGGPVHAVEEDGLVTGYLSVNPGWEARATHWRMPFGQVSNFALKTREAALAVLKLAGEMADQAGIQEVIVMESHRTRLTQTLLSLGGTYRLRSACDLPGLDAEMAAVIDLPRLTGELRDEFEGRLFASPARDVEAALSLGAEGVTVGFRSLGGRLAVVEEEQAVHRLLPRWVLTRLYMGYYSGEDVLNLGPLPWDRSDGRNPDAPDLDMGVLALPEPEAALFRALFPKLWPCSIPDPDVWPWVLGEPHPAYQHEDAKTPAMKAHIDGLRFPWVGY